MYRIYYSKDGSSSAIPFSREEAKRSKSKIYTGDEPCEDCGKRERYTRSNTCVKCSIDNANDLYCYLAQAMKFEYHPTDPQGTPPIAVHDPVILFGEQRKYFKDRIVTWEHENTVHKLADLVSTPDYRRFARSAKEAIELGVERYVVPIPCEISGHYGILTLEGRCHFCEEERSRPSPRQEALMAGKTWYIPAEPCPRCGERAERRVADGRCRGCVPGNGGTVRDGRRSETSVMMAAAPDMVLSREDARKLGLKVFRTGEPCRRGHTGFRWVSTGHCIDCLKGR